MADLSQFAFDRAEDAAVALEHMDGLLGVLETELFVIPMGDREKRIWPLIAAMRFYRNEADRATDDISRSGGETGH